MAILISGIRKMTSSPSNVDTDMQKIAATIISTIIGYLVPASLNSYFFKKLHYERYGFHKKTMVIVNADSGTSVLQ